MQKLLIVFFLVISSMIDINAQAPGLVVQTGLVAGFSGDKNVTPSGTGHYGWTLGADFRILEGNLYFIMGGHYQKVNLAGSSSPNPFKDKDWSYLSGRFGVGFNFLRISELIALRSKVVGVLNFNNTYPTDGLNIEGYKKVNDSFFGIGTGLGITIGKLEFDLDYQHGLLNNYNKQPNTKFNIYSLAAGYRF